MTTFLSIRALGLAVLSLLLSVYLLFEGSFLLGILVLIFGVLFSVWLQYIDLKNQVIAMIELAKNPKKILEDKFYDRFPFWQRPFIKLAVKKYRSQKNTK